MNQDYTAIVVGGGPVGLASACLLAIEGISVCLIAPVATPDLRTVALMQPAIRMLQHLGVWPGQLQQSSAALRQLHIVDDTGNYATAPTLRFFAEEIAAETFGWNIPLSVLVPKLRDRVAELNIPVISGRVRDFSSAIAGVTARIEDHGEVHAKVALAADGRHSLLRKSVGITTTNHNWRQRALISTFSHTVPHCAISTEHHRPGGLFTTVPLPGNHSSFVWMDRPEKIDALVALPPEKLCTELQLASHGKLGRVYELGKSSSFDMQTTVADQLAASRVFLVGEAAHGFPPIGAQGLNLSFRDAGHAADIIVGADDPGSAACCAAYHTARLPDVLPRNAAISAMNWSLLADNTAISGLRSLSLAMVDKVPALRSWVVSQGLTPTVSLPLAMRA